MILYIDGCIYAIYICPCGWVQYVRVCVCKAFHFSFFSLFFFLFLESGTLGTRQYTLNRRFMCMCWYEFYVLGFGGAVRVGLG